MDFGSLTAMNLCRFIAQPDNARPARIWATLNSDADPRAAFSNLEEHRSKNCRAGSIAATPPQRRVTLENTRTAAPFGAQVSV
jgi:hypothetical protein